MKPTISKSKMGNLDLTQEGNLLLLNKLGSRNF